MEEFKVGNWIVEFTSNRSGWLTYDGKTIPKWGTSMSFYIQDKYIEYDFPLAVPKYVKKRLLDEDIKRNWKRV